MNIHILIDWEGGGVIGAFENKHDAQDTLDNHQFPQFCTIDTFDTIKGSVVNERIDEFKMYSSMSEYFPIEIAGTFWDTSEIDDEIHRLEKTKKEDI